MSKRIKTIGYIAFGRDVFAYGIALTIKSLDKKYKVYRVSPKTAKFVDLLLFSCFWWEHIYLLAAFLRKACIKKSDTNRPKIIIGGFNTFNPVPFMDYSDVVVCGDGENIINKIIENIDDYKTKGYTEWHNENMLMPFAHTTNNIARIEIARGCKYNCKFCALKHLKPYRELEYEKLEKLIIRQKEKRLALFAPEPNGHKDNDKLTKLVANIGKHRIDTDMRLNQIGSLRQKSSVIRTGIEGLSERLRKSINKPYSNDFIIDKIKWMINNKVMNMIAYIILDLPTEKQEDYDEFQELLNRIDNIPNNKNFVLKLHPNAFMPNPHTPMEYDKINYNVDFRKKWFGTFRKKGEYPYKFKLLEQPSMFSIEKRIISMVSTRAGREFIDIENMFHVNKLLYISPKDGSIRVKNLRLLINILNRFKGADYYCGEYNKAKAVWNIISPQEINNKKP